MASPPTCGRRLPTRSCRRLWHGIARQRLLNANVSAFSMRSALEDPPNANRPPVRDAVNLCCCLSGMAHLRCVSRVYGLRRIFFLLRCHFRGVFLAGNASRSQLGPLLVLFGELGLAAIDWFVGHIIVLSSCGSAACPFCSQQLGRPAGRTEVPFRCWPVLLSPTVTPVESFGSAPGPCTFLCSLLPLCWAA